MRHGVVNTRTCLGTCGCWVMQDAMQMQMKWMQGRNRDRRLLII
jgi:hypothetical protein